MDKSGQGLGAAIIGAIFNNSFLHQMKQAPEGLSASTKDILKTLRNPEIAESSKAFLREAINTSMHYIYWGLILFTLFIFLFMYLVPHRDPKDNEPMVLNWWFENMNSCYIQNRSVNSHKKFLPAISL